MGLLQGQRRRHSRGPKAAAPAHRAGGLQLALCPGPVLQLHGASGVYRAPYGFPDRYLRSLPAAGYLQPLEKSTKTSGTGNATNGLRFSGNRLLGQEHRQSLRAAPPAGGQNGLFAEVPDEPRTRRGAQLPAVREEGPRSKEEELLLIPLQLRCGLRGWTTGKQCKMTASWWSRTCLSPPKVPGLKASPVTTIFHRLDAKSSLIITLLQGATDAGPACVTASGDYPTSFKFLFFSFFYVSIKIKIYC
ncbi:uncharacterized protein LOC110402387 [Numida meleagris]|uniref:uncharacterized protein LOC110402387 n=1 Tax=Numida meleagris TaxID=8996 RepID=UPI000B3DCA85|nr:uncharacterized protein LOC110402387 [Numida meleagris]